MGEIHLAYDSIRTKGQERTTRIYEVIDFIDIELPSDFQVSIRSSIWNVPLNR